MDPREIFEVMKEKIVWLDLKPESVINLTELAETFGVSRTPIKECLIRLEAQGWVLRHESTFIVTPLSLNRIKDCTEIRSVLEVQAYVWAMDRITAEELAGLEQLEKEIMKVKKTESNKKMVEMDIKFHTTIYRATKNERLSEFLESLLCHYQRFWLSIAREIDHRAFFSETLNIIEAIRQKDETAIRLNTGAHIRKSADEITKFFSLSDSLDMMTSK